MQREINSHTKPHIMETHITCEKTHNQIGKHMNTHKTNGKKQKETHGNRWI